MPATKCKKCGRRIPPQSGPGRPRLHCEICVPSESKRVTEIRPGIDPGLPTVFEASQRKLRDAGRLDDPEAAVVLNLARSIDEGGHSGASLASLSREFRAALEAALSDAIEEQADDGLTWHVG